MPLFANESCNQPMLIAAFLFSKFVQESKMIELSMGSMVGVQQITDFIIGAAIWAL